MSYSSESDREAMYAFITPLLREHRIRKGQIQPSTEDERRWASEGPRAFRECETFGRAA